MGADQGRSMHIRYLVPAMVMTLLPGSLQAQVVSVSPACGNADTHFIVGGGGWASCKCSPCTGGFGMEIRNQGGTTVKTLPFIPNQGKCADGFSVDLHDVHLS